MPVPKKYLDAVTMDHKVMNEGQAAGNGERYACIMLDRFTHWLQAFPSVTKTAEERGQCLSRFFGNQKAKHMYTDVPKKSRKHVLISESLRTNQRHTDPKQMVSRKEQYEK